MRLVGALALFLSTLFVDVSPIPVNETVSLNKGAIDPAVYDTLFFYFKYAASAYSDVCPKPNGNTFIVRLKDIDTDTQGYIARDDTKKEIVAAFRGSTSLQNFITDANFVLVPFRSFGVSPPSGTSVHAGFLTAWNSVASIVISTIQDQLAAYPGYSIATTGHSLGAALSSIAAISLKANFPNRQVRMFTYGQPRTGNEIYAAWVNQQFGSEAFRVVHTTDPVPQIPPRFLGYLHHGVEYWNYQDPSTPSNVKQCAAGEGEDPTCSASVSPIVADLSPAHLFYFNTFTASSFCT